MTRKTYKRRNIVFKKRTKRERPDRNPMLYLGMDYVTLKLAGRIRIPKESKQLRLEPK
jgi:hypothetical protein